MELEEEVGWYANSPSPLKIFYFLFLWGGGGVVEKGPWTVSGKCVGIYMEGKKRKEVYGTLISRHPLHALDFCFPDVPERSSLLKAVDYLAKKWKAMEYCWPLN